MFQAKIFLLAVVATLAAAKHKLEPRIVQGRDAVRGQFPFYAFLQIIVPEGIANCGGSLISDEWVVTAAHCVKNAMQAYVHLGSLRVGDFSETGRELHIIDSANMFVYPRYSQLFFAWNDIGLVKLADAVVFNDVIKPIPFACSPPLDSDLDVIAVGNGGRKNYDTTPPPTLQYTELKTISKMSCLKTFPFLILRWSVICVKGEEKRSVCNGDSGGPLISSTNSLIGLTSFGSREGCENGDPQVFTSISKYADWIKEVSGVECQK